MAYAEVAFSLTESVTSGLPLPANGRCRFSISPPSGICWFLIGPPPQNFFRQIKALGRFARKIS